MNEHECVEYDEAADCLYVGLRAAEIAKTISLGDRRMIDVDGAGQFIGIEFTDVSAGVDLHFPGYGPESRRVEELLKGRPFKVFA